jgi:hypothetical protein
MSFSLIQRRFLSINLFYKHKKLGLFLVQTSSQYLQLLLNKLTSEVALRKFVLVLGIN